MEMGGHATGDLPGTKGGLRAPVRLLRQRLKDRQRNAADATSLDLLLIDLPTWMTSQNDPAGATNDEELFGFPRLRNAWLSPHTVAKLKKGKRKKKGNKSKQKEEEKKKKYSNKKNNKRQRM